MKFVLAEITDKFCELTGASIRQIQKEIAEENRLIHAEIELNTGTHKEAFFVVYKNEIRAEQIASLIEQMQPVDKWLLICNYIPAPVKKELKNQGLNYIEAAGNSYIKKDGIFFYINNLAVTEYRVLKEGKLWKPAGLKFLFAVLIHPDLLNKPYREIARLSGIALGNIGDFIDELQTQGFATEGKREGKYFLFLENKTQLTNKWVELYNATLKPKIRKGKYRFANTMDVNKWENIHLKQALWGGEPAGALLTNYLVPQIFTLYTKQSNIEIMKELNLIPDNAGNVELIEMFWNSPIHSKVQNVVTPLLAYTDLVTSLDSRNRETAERIKAIFLI